MAATTITHTGGITLTSDAAFRTWGSAISTAIAAVGWALTADTGQVNWTTVTNPTANTFTAYEIWKMTDALQATDPCFLRITYTRNSQNAARMQITVGTSTDGAGNLTSAAGTNTSVTAANDVYNSTTPSSSTITHNSYVNGDVSSLVLFLSPLINGSATNGGLFVIERRRNPDGTAAAGGCYIGWVPGGTQSSASPTWQCVYTNNAYGQPASTTVGGPCVTGRGSASGGASTAGVRSNVVPLFPCLTGSYPEMGSPSKWLLGAYVNDIPLGQTVVVSHYGASQTFMSCGSTWFTGSAVRFGQVNTTDQLTALVRID